MYKIEENKIFYDGKLIFEAPWTIENSEENNNDLIIHYNIPPEEGSKFSSQDIYENVLCVDFNGQVKWRLPIREIRTVGPKQRPTYHDMGKGSDGSFWTGAGSYGYQFDPNTGKILKSEFTH